MSIYLFAACLITIFAGALIVGSARTTSRVVVGISLATLGAMTIIGMGLTFYSPPY